MCTASKKYQDIKLKELENKKESLTDKKYNFEKKEITDKSCLCVGLVNASYIENEIPVKGEKQGVVVCPGPNLAFFDKNVSLLEMVKHIYGGANVLTHEHRPNMFINELKLYVDYLKKEIDDFSETAVKSQTKKWNTFKSNLLKGIEYYKNLCQDKSPFFKKEEMSHQLSLFEKEILKIEIPAV